MNIWLILKSLKEDCLAKKGFIVCLLRENQCKEYENTLNVSNKFKMKTLKDYHDFYLKCDVLL